MVEYMKNVFAFIITLISLTLLTTVLAQPAKAASASCQPTYGGGENCVKTATLLLNKTVQTPQTKTFVDNLTGNDPAYAANQPVTFQITVTNTGDAPFQKVTLTDTLPATVSYVSGGGKLNVNTNTLTFDTFALQPQQARTFTITAQTLLMQGTGLACAKNKANATADSQAMEDTAQFCVQTVAASPTPTATPTALPKKKILLPVASPTPDQTIVASVPEETRGGKKVFPAPVTTKTPPTGPEALLLAALLPAGLLGQYLRKKS